MRRSRAAGVCAAVALGGVATTAAAHNADFSAFDGCPSRTPGVLKCVRVVTTSGEVVLGSRHTQLVRPVTLQGGVSATDETKRFMSRFYGAQGTDTLTRAVQPVGGGLSGVFAPAHTPPWLETVIAYVSKRGPTGVGATLELARPAEEIVASEYNLLAEEGVALRLPVRLHLENPILGSRCYIGSSRAPFIWNLTSGATHLRTAVASNGASGTVRSDSRDEILRITGARLVDHGWSAATASGCGGVLAPLIDPVIDSSFGLPASAGGGWAVLNSTIEVSTAGAVDSH